MSWGDSIHGGTVFTPTPGVSTINLYISLRVISHTLARTLCRAVGVIGQALVKGAPV